MKPLPKKMQDEYDAIGLPYSPLTEHIRSSISSDSRGFVATVIRDENPRQVGEFLVVAANSHHRLLAEIERLRELLKEADVAMDNLYPKKTPERDVHYLIKEALKETETE